MKREKPAVGTTNRAETHFFQAYQAFVLPHCLSRVTIGEPGTRLGYPKDERPVLPQSGRCPRSSETAYLGVNPNGIAATGPSTFATGYPPVGAQLAAPPDGGRPTIIGGNDAATRAAGRRNVRQQRANGSDEGRGGSPTG